MRPRATIISLLLLVVLCSVGLATAQPGAPPLEPGPETAAPVTTETATTAGGGAAVPSVESAAVEPAAGPVAVDRRPDSNSTTAANATESTVSDRRQPVAADGVALRTAPAVDPVDGPVIEITHDYSLHPQADDRVLVKLDVTVPENVRELRFDRPGSATVVDAGDFEHGGGDTYRWENDDRTRETVSLTVAAEPGGPGGDSYHGGDWAFVGGDLELAGNWTATYVGDEPRWERTGTVDGAGIAGARVAVLGDYEELSRTVHGQRLRLIVPEVASMEEPPDRVLDSLAFESRHVRVGNRIPELLVFVAPGPVRSGGKSLGNGEVWVQQDVSLSRNSWGHEYVHARQGYEVERDAKWLREAEAEYFENQLAYRQSHIGERSAWSDERLLRTNLERGGRDRHDDVVLAAPGTWADRSNYEKGALVLAALDLEIRERTDGEQTYQHVLRELNDRGTVDHATFADAVGTVAGEPMDDFLDRYVTGSGAPPVPDEAEFAAYERGDREFDVDLAVSLAGDGGTTITKGESVTLPVGVENAGSDPAIAVEAVLEVPEEWDVVDGGDAATDGGVAWTKRELAPGDRIGGDVTLRVPADASSGTDRLSLTATDGDGNAVTVGNGATAVGPPSAAVTVGDAVAGEPAALDASGSHADGAITAYRWDWTGDRVADATTDEPTVTGEFGDPGDHRVAVTVVDEYGNVDTASTTVVVPDAPSVTASGPGSVVEGTPVELDAAVDKEIGDYEVTWTFPDGSTETGERVERAFEPGDHRVEVAVVDEYGLEASDAVDVVVTDVPTVAIDAPETVVEGEPAVLAGTVENAVGEATVRWELPDGERVAGETVTVDLGPGEHEVVAVVRDEYGAATERGVTVTVTDEPEVTVVGADEVTAGDRVTLEAVVENAVGDHGVTWTFPDGSTETGERVERAFEPGDHRVAVLVTDEHGATGNASHRVRALEVTDERTGTDGPDGTNGVDGPEDDASRTDTDGRGAEESSAEPTADGSGADDLPGFGALAAIGVLLAIVGCRCSYGR